MSDQEDGSSRKNENAGEDAPQPTSPSETPADTPPWAWSDRPGCATLAAKLALQADTARERAAWYVVAASVSAIDWAALAATDAAMTVAQIVDHVSQRGDAERRWRAERLERMFSGAISVAAPVLFRSSPRPVAAAPADRARDAERTKKEARRPKESARGARRG